MEFFTPVSVDPSLPGAQQIQLHRMNCQGSLYYFIKQALKRRKLTDSLHLPLCLFLERDHIKDVIEWPRDHFKSTMAGEGLAMWRVLPFGDQDEACFRSFGYSDEFILWMKRRHNSDARNLLISENITNAAKLGSRVKYHFESNDIYRALFPETLPDSSCTWTNFSLHTKRPGTRSAGHGEGTFDFLGVGSALQSRHYNGIIIQDDIVGRKAVESPSVMEKAIEYHKLVLGAFEDEDPNHEGDELVIGNRWSYHDLNSHIREHEPWFQVTTHSALGGCCNAHPADTPILPEVFSLEKLMKVRARQGSYHFSCQYLNNPAAPENADFKESDLQFYELIEDGGERKLHFPVVDGVVRKDIKVSSLTLAMVTDPNHSGQSGSGRCRHAILVVGLAGDGRYFLLEAWAEGVSYDKYFDKLYEIGRKWQIRKLGFETVAAQKFAAYHINYRNRLESWPLKIIELKGEVEAPDGMITKKKEWRIRNVLAPIFEQQRFYITKRMQDFIGEFVTFPKGRFVDQLDALAYVPQMCRMPMNPAVNQVLLARNQADAKLVGKRYSPSTTGYMN